MNLPKRKSCENASGWLKKSRIVVTVIPTKQSERAVCAGHCYQVWELMNLPHKECRIITVTDEETVVLRGK